MNRAIFLDRDGVINRNIFYSDTGEWESPRIPDDVELHSNVIEALRMAEAAGYKLFVVSNQPNAAKGKSTVEELQQAHEKLARVLQESGIRITEFYYCYHHPDSTSKPFGGRCDCRKPSPYFLHKAEKDYRIDLQHSWMIGDRATDIACGISAGVRTVRVLPDHPSRKNARTELPTADYYAMDLLEALQLIVQSPEADAVAKSRASDRLER